jgi:putative nucleotidyltransferase with HDIG domain
MQLANKEDVPLHILSSLIASDPAFASEVLTVANSPLFAPRTPAESVFQAVARMGTRNVQGLCLTVAVRSYLGKALSQPATRALWRHNLACAVVAERLAAHTSLDKDIAFTSGIMHDIGRLAPSTIRPAEYAAVLMQHVGSAASILDAERDLFGADHCQAGRRLIAEWRLPPSFEGAVARHHETGTTGGVAEMTGVISLSCRMADAAGYTAFEGCQPEPYAALLAELPAAERSLLPQKAEDLAAQIHNRIHEVEPA